MVQTDDISVLEATPSAIRKTKEMFPQSPLPTPLPPNSMSYELEKSSLVAALLCLKRGKAPGLSGWTRELLVPLLGFDLLHPFFKFLLTLFQDIVNGCIEYSEEMLLRTGALTLLGYKAFPDKIRPIVVKDVVLKVAFMCLLKSKSLSITPLPGSTFGKKGGSAIAVATVQQQLIDGCFVLCCDAKNAFNLCSRKAAFTTLLSPEMAHMRDIFPLFNMIYAKVNYALVGGERIEISTGTSQGDVSGPLFLELCKLQCKQLFSTYKITTSSVSDDFHFHFKNKNELVAIEKVIVFLQEEIGLDLCGPKMKLLCPHPITTPIIPSFKDVDHIWTPASILGSVVYPPHCVTLDAADLYYKARVCLNKSLSKIDASVKFILACQASKQIKYSVLRSLQFSSLYLMSSMLPSTITDQILSSIEEKYLSLFNTLFEVPPQYRDLTHQVRTQSPIEDGGLGLLPLSFLRPHLYENNIFEANTLRAALHLPQVPNVKKNGDLKIIWKTFPPNNQKDPSYHQGSFLSVWPSKPLLTIDDASFMLGVQHRLGFLPPLNVECPLHVFNLNTLQPHEFLMHFESCNGCGTKMWWHRHERVNNVICKTFKYHNIVCEINPPDFPLPGANRGGPDFLLFVSSRIFAGDVRVTHQKTNQGFSEKMRKYREFAETTTFDTFPFVMSTTGKIDYGSFLILQKIQELSTSKKLISDIISHSQIELLKGMYVGYLRLKAKSTMLMPEESDDAPPMKRHREQQTQSAKERLSTASASPLSSQL